MALTSFESTDQRIRGAVVGIVTDVNDPEELGRVEIELPWYASGYREWARVSHLYAGPGYGSTWVPEVDGEVLVLFAHGDMRWPFVVGCLYSPVDQPPESRSDSSDVRTLLTPNGSELRFDETNQVGDAQDEERCIGRARRAERRADARGHLEDHPQGRRHLDRGHRIGDRQGTVDRSQLSGEQGREGTDDGCTRSPIERLGARRRHAHRDGAVGHRLCSHPDPRPRVLGDA